ncbi:MAG: ABC transporter permease subunit [Armatimonadota bacterium]|nr:ABC transporter permease subunit [Armatimonadota bacterium]
MRKVLTIAGKELRSYFVSPMGYVVLGFLLGVGGLIFALTYTAPQMEADPTYIIRVMVFLILLMSPVITMGLLAQEWASGSIELLMTNPVRDVELILGKYLAAVTLLVIALAASLEFPLILEKFGDPDWMVVLTGYIGVLLAGMSFLAIGLFASSLTSNQIASGLLGFVMLLFFWLIGWLGYNISSKIGEVAKYISVFENIQDFSKGIIDLRPVVFFLSLIAFFLMLSVRTVENRRTA